MTTTYIVTSANPTDSWVLPLSGPEDDQGLSGGAKAGIVIGSVSGALILVGLAIWWRALRRRTSASEALLPGFEEAIAPLKASFRKKPEPTSLSHEMAEAPASEPAIPGSTLGVFELESPQQRYTDGLHEMPER